MDGKGLDLEVDDGFVYVTNDHHGVRAIDVSDPTKPFELGAFNPRGEARSLALADGLTYVADVGANLLRIIDFGPEYARTRSVDLDIKPGSDSNPVNFSIQGVVPVAILGSSEFDVADVDATTLAFGPSNAAPDHSHGPHVEDVNGDGFPDLLCHFRTDETGIAFGDRTACLEGKSVDGTPLNGCDAVRTVPDKDGDGLLDEQESSFGTHDLNPDTDGDGLEDGDEVFVLQSDPLDALDPAPEPVQQPKRRARRRR